MQLDSFCSSFRYIGEISWNERLFICYVRGMWLNGTRKMRLFAKENQDIRKISPTFFLRLIFMLQLRMSCSSCTWLVYLPPITLLPILQWHTEVSEETLDVKSYITQTTQNIWNFIDRKSNLQEIANFGNYPGAGGGGGPGFIPGSRLRVLSRKDEGQGG